MIGHYARRVTLTSASNHTGKDGEGNRTDIARSLEMSRSPAERVQLTLRAYQRRMGTHDLNLPLGPEPPCPSRMAAAGREFLVVEQVELFHMMANARRPGENTSA